MFILKKSEPRGVLIVYSSLVEVEGAVVEKLETVFSWRYSVAGLEAIENKLEQRKVLLDIRKFYFYSKGGTWVQIGGRIPKEILISLEIIKIQPHMIVSKLNYLQISPSSEKDVRIPEVLLNLNCFMIP